MPDITIREVTLANFREVLDLKVADRQRGFVADNARLIAWSRYEQDLVPSAIYDDDGYFAYCPSLRGCYTQGDTYEEALANIQDAMRLHIEDRHAKGENIAACLES